MNSRVAVGHRNSCNSHAAELRGEVKALSTSTRCKVGRLAEKELAPFQQASPMLHEETWAGLFLTNQGLKISQEVEIIPGCAVSVAFPSCSDHLRQSCSEHVRLVTVGEKRSVWDMVVPGCPKRREHFLPLP